MLQPASGLSAADLSAIGDLERHVVNEDGGRLKLEWGSLRTRSGDRVEDLLWWDAGQLVGFLGLYTFGSSLELAGMVAPAARRRGVATALLQEALVLCGDRQALLVVPRPSTAGRILALRFGAVADHSEHALVLLTEPPAGAGDARLRLREAVSADGGVVSELLAAGFGHATSVPVEQVLSPHESLLVVELAGVPVGTLRVTRDGADAGVYGFVIDPGRQGRGLGREALRLACTQLRAEGARSIGLEVSVDNDRALGLYTSLGFTEIATEDYYALRVSSR